MLAGHTLLHPAIPPARLGHHACSIQCQTLSPSRHHSVTRPGPPGQHNIRPHFPPLISPPQHCCRLWDSPGIINPPTLPTNIPTAPHSDYTGPQWEQSNIQDDYTHLTGILPANHGRLLPTQIWLG